MGLSDISSPGSGSLVNRGYTDRRCPRDICDGTGWVRTDHRVTGAIFKRCGCNPDLRNSASDQGSYRNRALHSE